jgi:hypothetical protein
VHTSIDDITKVVYNKPYIYKVFEFGSDCKVLLEASDPEY